MKKKTSALNYQLGEYVGEVIYLKYLPTLSTDLLKTPTIVQVSEEDTQKHKEVSDALNKTYKWNGGDGDGEKEFATYKSLNNELARKYLPNKLHCLVPRVTPTCMESFRKGLNDYLWDTDLSHYLPDDNFYIPGSEKRWCSTIILTLMIEE